MPSAGRRGAVVLWCSGVIALLVATSAPAVATLYPPPIRLALLFDRVQWSVADDAQLPVPPGLIINRWER